MAYSSRLDQRYSTELLAFIARFPVGTPLWLVHGKLTPVVDPASAPKFRACGNCLTPYKD